MSRDLRIAWAVRHWMNTSSAAVDFRNLGMVEAARHWAAMARQDWQDLQRLLGAESASKEAAR